MSLARDDRRFQVYQGVCFVNGCSTVGTGVAAVSVLHIMVNVTVVVSMSLMLVFNMWKDRIQM